MSAPLVVSIPHRLGREEALRRLRTGLSRARAGAGGFRASRRRRRQRPARGDAALAVAALRADGANRDPRPRQAAADQAELMGQARTTRLRVGAPTSLAFITAAGICRKSADKGRALSVSLTPSTEKPWRLIVASNCVADDQTRPPCENGAKCRATAMTAASLPRRRANAMTWSRCGPSTASGR